MALNCPNCHFAIRDEFVNIQADTAKCTACGEVFRVSEALPDTAAARDLKPPAPEVAYVEYARDGGITVVLHRQGFRKKSVSALVFSGLWLAITSGVSIGMGVSVFQGEGPGIFGLLFLVPFWAVGLGMLYWGLWLALGATAIQLTPDEVVLGKMLFGRTRKRVFRLEDVERFSREVSYKENDVPVYACAVNFGSKHKNFGHHLSDADQEWLVAELNASLKKVRG